MPGDHRRQVFVIGESLIDVVVSADAPAQEHVGGSPANVALGLARLGVGVRLHTALARDDRGRVIREHLERDGVDIDPESWSLRHTSTAVARIGAGGVADYDFAVEWQVPVPPVLAGEAVVHTGSIAAFMEPGATAVRAFLASLGSQVRVTFDPNIRPALIGGRDAVRARMTEIARRAYLVKLSDEDAEWLYPGVPIGEVVDALLDGGTRIVVVTRGAQGALLAAGADRVTVEAAPAVVVDTVGAGDTFMAALIDGIVKLAPGDPLDPRILAWLGRRAAAAAGVTVQRVAADLPTWDDVVASGFLPRDEANGRTGPRTGAR